MVPAAIPWDMSDQGDTALATPSAAPFARRTPILRKERGHRKSSGDEKVV